MSEIQREARRAVLVAGVLVAVLFAWTNADAQSAKSAANKPRVEKMKDELDARVPPDAPARTMAVEALATGDYRIDALLSGYKWSITTITYSFYEDGVFGGAYYGTETGVREVSEPVKTNVRAIMAHLGTLMNLNFVEVTETSSTVGYVRIMLSNSPSYAYAYYPSSSTLFSLSGDVHLNPSYDRLVDTNGFQQPAGEHGYTSLIHEIGHAVGLKHPHDSTPNLPAAEDTHTRTVMSYNFPGESPGTPMAYDLLALHYLYGARSNRTSNDSYLFTRAAIDQYSLSGQLFLNPSMATKQTIWDNGGYNVVDLSGITASSSGYRLDLNPLGWMSTVANYQTTYLVAGTVVGPGVSIRKVVNSGGNDTIYANADPNVFAGYALNRPTGTDVLYGADDADTIDLSGYAPGDVSQTQSGNDLVLGFGTNGSLRLKDYYLGAPPAIVFDGLVPSVSIGDVATVEGNAGTKLASFPVNLSAPAASTQSVSFATVNASAQAGTDYVATSGVISFAAGETQKVVTVSIVGDTTQEADETFSVMLSAPSSGMEVLDGQGDGVILNDDQPPNQLPVAVASATPSTGFAPLTVAFSSTGSYDPDGNIASYAWTFGDGTTSTLPGPSHTYNGVGSYTATLTVTDNRGGTNARALAITVQQNSNTILFVGDIAMQALSSSAGGYARATVTIRRPDGQPVAGVTVSGKWAGLVKATGAATTDANGRAVLTSKPVKKRGTITFAVTGVAKSGFTYDASRNVETTDSVVIP